jgi:hypothetical protein
MTNALSGRMIALAFVAGVLATLIPHQLFLLAAGVEAYSRAPTWPFGIWAFVSLSFFGGLWGILLAFIVPRLRAPFNDWLGWLILGALGPSLVFWAVVTPLKYPPNVVSSIFSPRLIISVLLVNAIWGIGTWVFIKLGNMLMSRASTA